MVFRKAEQGGKFEEITTNGILIGFIDHNHTYKVYELHCDKVKIVHNVIFLENTFPYRQQLTEPPPCEEEDRQTTEITDKNPLPTDTQYQKHNDDDDDIINISLAVDHDEGFTTLHHETTRTRTVEEEDVTNPVPTIDRSNKNQPETRRSGRE